ncbi:GapR family DNA-binding domain-containing protein [Devosia honganensis]|uniref:GapR family DNA-binding domain-containing protein n=1 Tax=Devosia honganensis TaxID=1610527 RepID=A0ABV7X4R4_9HYPH
MTDGVADDELAAFIDRILRMKAEEDAIKADVREIYAEAKARGYDKTRLGEVVSHIRKVEKDADGEAEKEVIRDLYLTAYYRAKNKPHAHAYARAEMGIGSKASNSGLHSLKTASEEITPEHDAETGEITEQQDAPHPAGDLTNPPSLSGQVAPHPVAKAADEAAPGSAMSEASTVVDAPEEAEAASRPDAGRTASATSEDMDVTGGESAAKDGGQELSVSSAPASAIEFEDSASDAGRAPSTEQFPPVPMRRLPYADCFPAVLGAAYERLGDDIGTNGVQRPIVRMGDVIVDGWARYNICRALGVEYPVIQYSGNDVLMDVIAWQRRDRDFTPAQEKQIAAKLVKAVPHRAADILAAFDLAEEMAGAE